MYNRYIAQPDGSFQRRRMQEMRPPGPPQPPKPPEQPDPPPQPPCEPKPSQRPRPPQPQACTPGGFFKQLLPKDFDMGDLMIVLLLLVMAGDSKEDHNTALLTLALYLFM